MNYNELFDSSNEYNLYCDESCYMENDHKKYMIVGTIKCPKKSRKQICNDIRNIKEKYNINKYQELKWIKISKPTEDLYKEIIDYFFSCSQLSFRCVIVDKTKLNHDKYNQTHNDFYYKLYYQLLIRGIVPNKGNYIYLDIKDTKNTIRIKKLTECLSNGTYDFEEKFIKNIQSINSKDSELLQLADIIIGAIGFIKRKENTKKNYSIAKENVAKEIKIKSGYNFEKSTFLSEEKFNIFIWRSNNE